MKFPDKRTTDLNVLHLANVVVGGDVLRGFKNIQVAGKVCSQQDTFVFLKIVAKGISEVDKKWISQVQMQLLVTGAPYGYMFFYHIHNGREMWHEIIIQRDESHIELIKDRIKMVVNLRQDFIKYITEKAQY